MRTLAVISRKGGVGKTTLSINLAVIAWRAGLKTVLADLDSQRSATLWSKIRTSAGPAVMPTSGGKLFPLWSAADISGCELMILDTPASPEAETLQALRLADLCLLVCRPAAFDVAALARSLELLHQFDKRGLIVLNQAPPRRLGQEPEAVLSAARTLQDSGVPLAHVGMRYRASFPASTAKGQSIEEFEPGGPAAREISGVWEQAEEMLGVARREPAGGALHVIGARHREAGLPAGV